MKVELNKTWFAPDAARRRKGQHAIPDAWADKLPPSAKVVVGPKVEAVKEPPAPPGEGVPVTEAEIAEHDRAVAASPKAGKKK